MEPRTLLDTETASFFRRGAALYPYPIAVACGRILRCRSADSLVDALLKGAEVLARYLAALALASWAAREESEKTEKIDLSKYTGALAFGTFLEITQVLSRTVTDHPLRSYLAAGFVAKGKTPGVGPCDDALTQLLNLRNELGHNLATLTAGRAKALLKDKQAPSALLIQALEGVRPILGLPLFIVEEQKLVTKRVVAQRLLLMGESSDPQPDEIALSDSLSVDEQPYLAVGPGAILLSPMLVWGLASSSANFKLFVFDTVKEDSIKYRAVEPSTLEGGPDQAHDLTDLLAGKHRALEPVSLGDGRTLAAEWTERRKELEHLAEHMEGRIPWDDCAPETMTWFATRLDAEGGKKNPRAVIQERLLDGRELLRPNEVHELLLLLGKDAHIHKRLGRELIDLRAIKDPNKRWDERVESHRNVLGCLEQAVEFLARHIGVDGVTIDGLQATSGTADYIAIREAVVNLFIHQDYSDKSAAAQVEIKPDRTVFFNPGKALVGQQSLIEGGKSQARNPLIARALRLIGFAELAGSGLRELQRVWRGAKRRPPAIESSPSANTFTLTLDWRAIPDTYDAYWKKTLGVKLTAEEATVLNLALDPAGVSLEQAASATGLMLEDAKAVTSKLVGQLLVEERKGRFYVKEHLRELVR